MAQPTSGCSNCSFWGVAFGAFPKSGVVVGYCRVSAPSTGTNNWPMVTSDRWCGAWKLA